MPAKSNLTPSDGHRLLVAVARRAARNFSPQTAFRILEGDIRFRSARGRDGVCRRGRRGKGRVCARGEPGRRAGCLRQGSPQPVKVRELEIAVSRRDATLEPQTLLICSRTRFLAAAAPKSPGMAWRRRQSRSCKPSQRHAGWRRLPWRLCSHRFGGRPFEPDFGR